MARGIMWVMMSGAAAGCQADRARRRAFGVRTRGGQSVPAALAAYLNGAFVEMKSLSLGSGGAPARDLISQNEVLLGSYDPSVRMK